MKTIIKKKKVLGNIKFRAWDLGGKNLISIYFSKKTKFEFKLLI